MTGKRRTRQTIGVTVAGAVLMAAGLAGVSSSAAVATPTDFPIVVGDQGEEGQLIAFDPAATNWDSASSVLWSWKPTSTDTKGFSAAERKSIGWISDFKLRNSNSGQRIVFTAAEPQGGSHVEANRKDIAAIVNAATGQKVWSVQLPSSASNLHSAELLPNGNLAIAASGNGGFVQVYATGTGLTASAKFNLVNGHGTVWDPTTERLWVIGKAPGTGPTDPTADRILTALAVTGSAAAPHLTEDDTWYRALPDIGPHDLTPEPNDAHKLLLSAAVDTYVFDKAASTSQFTAISGDGTDTIKSISRQPSGQLVETKGNVYSGTHTSCAISGTDWCTDTVSLYGPNATRVRTGAHIYRARVWNPDYNAVGDTVHGPVSDRSHTSGGSWTPATIDTTASVAVIAAASVPYGPSLNTSELHVVSLRPGAGVWDQKRDPATGTWSTPTQIDSNAAITAVSAAALPDGTLHVQTVVPGSGVYDRTRNTAGTWSSATQIDTNGLISAVSAAAPGGLLHVQTLIPGQGVWNRSRNGSGTWGGAAKIADGCDTTAVTSPCITALSSASLPDGTMHLQTLTPSTGVSDRTRSTSGTWSAPILIDANGAITRVSAAALPDGTLHVQTVVPHHGLWDRTRAAGSSGAWSSATKIDANTNIFATYGAGFPENGTLHVGSAAY